MERYMFQIITCLNIACEPCALFDCDVHVIILKISTSEEVPAADTKS